MEIITEFYPDKKTERGLQRIPDDILFSIAKQTLDMAISREYIPIGKTHNLKESSASYGVHRKSGEMTIGSFTEYASYVWNMPQTKTHWTNKPHSKSQWYSYTLKVHGKQFIDTAINKTWKEDM